MPEELIDYSNPAQSKTRVYNGTLELLGGEAVIVQEAAERSRCGEFTERTGRWAITSFGVECLATDYSIAHWHVHEKWLDQLRPKKWVTDQDATDLTTILRLARKRWPAGQSQ